MSLNWYLNIFQSFYDHLNIFYGILNAPRFRIGTHKNTVVNHSNNKLKEFACGIDNKNGNRQLNVFKCISFQNIDYNLHKNKQISTFFLFFVNDLPIRKWMSSHILFAVGLFYSFFLFSMSITRAVASIISSIEIYMWRFVAIRPCLLVILNRLNSLARYIFWFLIAI